MQERYMAYSEMSKGVEISCSERGIKTLLFNGLITEVKPAVWNDNDMINMIFYARSPLFNPENTLYHFKEYLSDFKKEKGL
jgi:hypothetical protein